MKPDDILDDQSFGINDLSDEDADYDEEQQSPYDQTASKFDIDEMLHLQEFIKQATTSGIIG